MADLSRGLLYSVFYHFTCVIRIGNHGLVGIQINIEPTHLVRLLPRQNEFTVIRIQHSEIAVKSRGLVSKPDESEEALDDWRLNRLVHFLHAIIVAIDGPAFTRLLHPCLVILSG